MVLPRLADRLAAYLDEAEQAALIVVAPDGGWQALASLAALQIQAENSHPVTTDGGRRPRGTSECPVPAA